MSFLKNNYFINIMASLIKQAGLLSNTRSVAPKVAGPRAAPALSNRLPSKALAALPRSSRRGASLLRRASAPDVQSPQEDDTVPWDDEEHQVEEQGPVVEAGKVGGSTFRGLHTLPKSVKNGSREESHHEWDHLFGVAPDI